MLFFGEKNPTIYKTPPIKYSRRWFLPFRLPNAPKTFCQGAIMPPREWPRSTTFCNCKCCTKSMMSLPDCCENSVGVTSPIAIGKLGKPVFFHQNFEVPPIAGDIFEAKFIGLEYGSDHSPSHQTPPISGHQSEARCHHAHRRPSARSWRAHMGQSRSSQSSWNSHDCGGTVQPKRWKALPNAFPVVQTH